MKLQVIKSFKDKQTKELYEAGAQIEMSDIARINDVVARGLCLIVDAESTDDDSNGEISLFDRTFFKKEIVEALKVVGVKGNVGAMKVGTMLAKVASLSDSELATFKEALSVE